MTLEARDLIKVSNNIKFQMKHRTNNSFPLSFLVLCGSKIMGNNYP